MRRITLRLLLLIFALSVVLQFGETAQAAQTINGKAIGSVDDVVKEISRGDLSLPKKGLITLRGLSNNDNTYLDVFASVFGADGSASAKRKIWSNPNPDTSLSKYENEPTFFRPAVSRRLYNGKRALMFHNTAFNGSLKYFFTTLSNIRGENSTETTPNALVNSVQISDFGEYILPTFCELPKPKGIGLLASLTNTCTITLRYLCSGISLHKTLRSLFRRDVVIIAYALSSLSVQTMKVQ